MKKKYRNILFLILVIVTASLIGCMGAGSYSQGEGVYPPMVYVNDRLYLAEGRSVPKLYGVWGYEPIGTISKKISSTQKMPEENFTSNSVDVGKWIYAHPEDFEYIYVGIETEKYLLYKVQ